MSDAPPPALALLGGTLLPDPGTGADSVLVVGERIVRIGTEEAVEAAAPAGARRIPIRGRPLSAGFHDAHFHFLQTGLRAARPNLSGCGSREEMFAVLEGALRERPGDDVLFLEDWDETAWPDRRPPTRRDLERAAPRRPVIARRVDGHTAVANGPALEEIGRYWSGPGVDAESGLCREGVVLAMDDHFAPTDDEAREGFLTAARLCFRLGITTTCDFPRPEALRFYLDAFPGTGPMPGLDVFPWSEAMDRPGLLEPLAERSAFRLRGVKIFADGSIGARAAALFEPYADRPGDCGQLFHSDEELRRRIRRGHEAGWTVAVHAIGDRAIAQVVDAFAELPPDETRARRHRMEHFELPREREIDRITELGVRPCVQPNFVGRWAGAGGLYETALGAARARRMNPFADLVRRGTGVFFGSDGMPASPRFGIRSATSHPVREQRLDPSTACRLYTEDAAAAVTGSPESGQLREGARADLAVWTAGPQDPGDGVDLTVVGGRIVHDRLLLEGCAGRC